MGTLLPPNEPGTACSLCFGPSGFSGPVTPKFIDVEFRNVKPGPSWFDGAFLPHGSYRLQQIAACLWRLIAPGEFSMSFGFGAVRTRCSVDMIGTGTTIWLGVVGAVCNPDIAAGSDMVSTGVLVGGTIHATWPMKGL